jgi:hypothetical protein
MEQAALPGFDLPPVVEVLVRVGMVPEANHLQWQIEVRNPVTQELLAMESCPHFTEDRIGPQASRISLRLITAMREAMGYPEPGNSR